MANSVEEVGGGRGMSGRLDGAGIGFPLDAGRAALIEGQMI